MFWNGRSATHAARRRAGPARQGQSGPAADVALILEGSYPYVRGGVSSWTQDLIRAQSHLTFHVVSLTADNLDHAPLYDLPDNVTGFTRIPLDGSTFAMRSGRWSEADALETLENLRLVICYGDRAAFRAAAAQLARHGADQWALMDSRAAWLKLHDLYEAILPDASFADFFWTWRVLARSLMATLAAPLPSARVFHAISTGYAGLYGARCAHMTGRPLAITEHGIYTNERRMEITTAEWLYDSGRGGFAAENRPAELRDVWLTTFSSFARLAYEAATTITTLYEGNQEFQRADDADPAKLQVIPNGVDLARFARPGDRKDPRPTVGLIGRVVPIKDVRGFIQAVAGARRVAPNIRALIIGPHEEDPDYVAECKTLAAREGLEDVIEFTGQRDVPSILPELDIVALSSISEAMPLVLLEAGAAGIPAVATDVGACREILLGRRGEPASGDGGIVVPVGDMAAMADAFVTLLTNPMRRKAMGAALRRRMETVYDKVVIDRAYAGLYATLKGENRVADAALQRVPEAIT